MMGTLIFSCYLDETGKTMRLRIKTQERNEIVIDVISLERVGGEKESE